MPPLVGCPDITLQVAKFPLDLFLFGPLNLAHSLGTKDTSSRPQTHWLFIQCNITSCRVLARNLLPNGAGMNHPLYTLLLKWEARYVTAVGWI